MGIGRKRKEKRRRKTDFDESEPGAFVLRGHMFLCIAFERHVYSISIP
jgi:hypothetical protein